MLAASRGLMDPHSKSTLLRTRRPSKHITTHPKEGGENTLGRRENYSSEFESAIDAPCRFAKSSAARR